MSAWLTWCVVGMAAAVVVLGHHPHHSFVPQEFPGQVQRAGRSGGAADKPTHPCGSYLCRCRYSVANCSRVSGGLQYIPPLPPEIRYLAFSYNQLRSIPAEFFRNVSKLIKVDISHNNLTFLSPHAFRPLTNLKILFLSGNPDLSYASLAPAFGVSTLQELDIMSCALGPMPADLFHKASLHKLRKLLMHDNDIGPITLSMFQPLTALKELGLATNQITAIHSDSVLNVEKINLDSNALYLFLTTCNSTTSFFPHLRNLLLQGNQLSLIPDPVCLPRVQVIALGENKFSKIPKGTFSATRFPSLIQVSMFSMNSYINVIEENAFSHPLLYRIDLAYNGIPFNSPGIHHNSFAHLPHLRNLELSNNKVDIGEDRFIQLFGNLSSVNLVDMQRCALPQLSRRMLSGLRNLTYLHLGRNSILSLSDGLFDDLPHLQQLQLCQNQIRSIQPAVFSAATHNRLKSIDLSGNPFSCDCDLLWFQSWLVSNASVFSKSWTSYDCHNGPNVSVQHFFMAQQACLLSPTTYILLDSVVTLLIVILVIVFGLVRYRWHLRLLLYETFGGRNEARRRYLRNACFAYDVFVIYDPFDDMWVREYLVPELEERLHLRLCLQERDLDSNKPELLTISESVEKSQKVLVLFSSNFAHNQLCQFQLSMCLQHALDHHDAPVIACLDYVTPREMTSAMMSVLRTTPYIQWAEEVDAVASFWGRLHIALQEVIQQRGP